MHSGIHESASMDIDDEHGVTERGRQRDSPLLHALKETEVTHTLSL